MQREIIAQYAKQSTGTVKGSGMRNESLAQVYGLCDRSQTQGVDANDAGSRARVCDTINNFLLDGYGIVNYSFFSSK